MTTSYHPEANGLCERFNGILKRMMSSFLTEKQNTWDEYLSLVVYGYNTNLSPATGMSPFKVVFGAEPRIPGCMNLLNTSVRTPRNSENTEHLKQIWNKALYELEKSAEKMKSKVDRKREDSPFEEGDIVLLLNTLHPPNTAKSFRENFSGPHLILKLFSGVNACILHLHTKERQNVHIKRLKRYFTTSSRSKELHKAESYTLRSPKTREKSK